MIPLPPVCTADVEFFLTTHPDDPTQTARVGRDPERGGIYVEIEWNGTVVTFDQADLDDDDATTGVVRLLATWGFIDPCALADVRAWMSTPSCWRRRRAPRGVRRVLAIVEELKAASTSSRM